MAVDLLPDVEALVSTYLRARSEVTALVSTRVYTAIPNAATFPLVRVVRVGGAPVIPGHLRLDVATIQVDAFGGPKATAWTIAETCRAVIETLPTASHAEGFVTAVRFGPMNYLPDTAYAEAKPRYTFDVDVFFHR